MPRFISGWVFLIFFLILGRLFGFSLGFIAKKVIISSKLEPDSLAYRAWVKSGSFVVCLCFFLFGFSIAIRIWDIDLLKVVDYYLTFLLSRPLLSLAFLVAIFSIHLLWPKISGSKTNTDTQ